MIRVNIINGIIVLGSDGNDLLTMKQMTKAYHAELMEMGLDRFREITANEVKKRFDEVEPHFVTDEDRDDAIGLVEAKYREFPGTTGIQKDYDIRPNESR
jgi:hypothetical protein